MLSELLQASTFGFLSSLDAQLPGLATALYVVGSAALGDYSERVSNLDVVVVSEEPWTPEALNLAVAAQGAMKQGRPPVVAYVVSGDLMLDPRLLDRPCYEGSTRVESERLVNPMTWNILDNGAVDLRGPDHVELWDDPAARQSWAGDQLRSVWAPRLAHLDRMGAMWLRHEVSATVLNVCRLAVTATGRGTLSKTEAARVLEPHVADRFRRILADSVGYRSGGKTSMYWGPVERKQHAMELIHELVDGPDGGAIHAA